ncbi:MAG: DUF3108 domain-containing protein [Paludibacteraceae bacterium]
MKNNRKSIILFVLFFFSTIYSFGAGWSIIKGEKLHYKIAFSSALTGSVKGGEATLSVKSFTVKVGDKDAYLATLYGATTGLIEWIYQVENKYETYIDVNSGAPLMYRQSVRENKYRSSDTVYFDQSRNIATYKNKKTSVPDNTQDFVSMIYYVRSVNVSKMKKGDVFTIPFFTSDKVILSKVVFGGIEQITSNKKTVNCYAFKPQVGKGKVFNQDYPATIWISTDSKRQPVLIEARMKVGRVKMELLGSE